jgi:dTDP-4-dehydrorhamnose 3,5-epimerase
MAFEFRRLAIPDVWLIQSKVFPDNRGWFREQSKASEFAAAGLPVDFPQDNLSHSVRGVLRGLHYQVPPYAQGKLVSAVSGVVLDVAVDIRHGSPWFGRHVSAELSAENGTFLYVPAGFAHGFLVLSDTAAVLYKCTAEFAAGTGRTISWDDPDLAIPWPVTTPILSTADANGQLLRDAGRDFEYAG